MRGGEHDFTGRWASILIGLGVGTHLIERKKYGDCPFCGDTNKNARWHVKKEYFVCSKCGVTQPWGAISQVLNLDNKQTFKRIIGVKSVTVEAKEDIEENKKIITNIRGTLKKVAPGSVVETYLKSRWIEKIPPTIAMSEGFDWNTGTASPGNPVMVLPIQTPAGKLAAYHCTFLTADGKKRENTPKMYTKTINALDGAAIRLYPVEDELMITEGIESALAAHELTDLPVWACGSAWAIENFVPPETIQYLHVFADIEPGFVGLGAAVKLANRLHKEKSLPVDIHVVDNGGFIRVITQNKADAADFLSQKKWIEK